jgi:hypothetical protein
MKDDIRTKLAREFEEPIQTERHVVYILVETRKLMELEGIDAKYDVLTFCCDWAVHPKLDRAFSQKVIKIFDDYQDLFATPGGKSSSTQALGSARMPFDVSRLTALTYHLTFRQHLLDLYAAYKIDCEQLADDAAWAVFIELYCGVIQDCPLKAKTAQTKHVSEVLVRALPPQSPFRKVVEKLVLEWTWQDSAGNPLGEVNSFF